MSKDTGNRIQELRGHEHASSATPFVKGGENVAHEKAGVAARLF
jgi:hypothetical protein